MPRRLRFVPPGGALVEVTCRTVQGRLLLRPSFVLNAVTLGVLARAARRYEVEVHAYVFLSNHYHLLVSVSTAQQLAAFYLNVRHYLDGGEDFYLYAPEIGDTGPGGDYVSGSALLALADQALCDGYDSFLHGLLDDANNDLLTVVIVSPVPCDFGY